MTPRKVGKFALGLPDVVVDHPYGPDADVYKVAGKQFAILQADGDPPQVTLKCEPSLALELRAQFPAVIEGYHVNKKHWNTVLLDGSVPAGELREMVAHSYDRVVAGLPKKVREALPARQPNKNQSMKNQSNKNQSNKNQPKAKQSSKKQSR